MQVVTSARYNQSKLEIWEKRFGGFYLKKNDKMGEMVGVMKTFYQDINPSPIPRRQKDGKRKCVVDIPEDDELLDNEELAPPMKPKKNKKHPVKQELEPEFYEVVNRNALIELYHYVIISQESVYTPVMKP